jgi:transporter family protein
MSWFYLAFLCAIITTIGNLALKKAVLQVHSLQISAAAAIVAALISLVLIPFVDFKIDLKTILLLLLSSTVATASYLFIVKAYRHMEVSVVSPLFNVGTLLSIFFAMLFFHEKLTIIQLIGVLLLIFGAYFVNFKEKDILFPFKQLFKSEDYHHLIFSIVGYSLLSVLIKYILNFTDPYTYIFFETFFIAMFLTVYTIFFHHGFNDIKAGFSCSKWLIFLIASANFLSMVTWYLATSIGEVSLVVPVMRIWTLLAVIFGGLIYREKGLTKKVISCVIMLTGVFIITM